MFKTNNLPSTSKTKTYPDNLHLFRIISSVSIVDFEQMFLDKFIKDNGDITTNTTFLLK